MYNLYCGPYQPGLHYVLVSPIILLEEIMLVTTKITQLGVINIIGGWTEGMWICGRGWGVMVRSGQALVGDNYLGTY